MSKHGPSALPPGHLWLTAVPLLPLVLGTLFLRSLIDPERRLSFLKVGLSDYLGESAREFIHLGDMLTYSSFAAIHVVICIGVIVFLASLTRKLPAEARRKALAFIGVTAVLLVGLMIYFAWKANHLAIVQLGFKAICKVLETAELSNKIASGCFEPMGFSKLTLLAWVPAFLGMGAVALAAGFAYGNAAGLPAHTDTEWRSVFNERARGLQKSLYAVSLVLVSSTIVITLFAHLPTGLLDGEGELAAAYTKYANGLSTFWGALFSLTVAATFAAPAFLLFRQAYGYQSLVDDTASLRIWLHENIFVSIKKQLVNVATVLAPLLVGPLSSLLSSVAGA
jgi:hypothetical protein